MDTYYMRNPAFVMVSRSDSYYVLRGGETPFTIARADVEALSRLMQAAASPLSEEQVNELLDKETKASLIEQKILLRAPESVLRKLLPTRNAVKPCKHLVLGLSGAISSVQVVPLLLELVEQFSEKVDVILTDSVQRFVNPNVFPFLGIRAWTDAFAPREEINAPHIYLAQAAEMVVVLPASAHTLHKISQGACSDLLSLTIAATQAPVLLVPAMNRAMWSNPAIRRSLGQLRKDGFYVVEPGLGREISQSGDETLEYGVAGLGRFGLVQLLEGIMSLHKQ